MIGRGLRGQRGGRDAVAGGASPGEAVPYQKRLALAGRYLLGVQSVVLAGVGVAGVVVSASYGLWATAPTFVLGLRMNLAHSALLLITAVAAGASLLGSRQVLRGYTLLQTVVYLLVFVFGLAFSVGPRQSTGLDLNALDDGLHALLALIGFVVFYVLIANILETDPTSPPPSGQRRCG